MDCLSENTLQQLLDGKLSASERRDAHLHFDTCAACREMFSTLARVLSTPASGPPPDSDGSESPVDESRAVRHAIAPGTQVNRFIIQAPLGAGGMGVVYVADDPVLGRKVALKLIHADYCGGPASEEWRVRLIREARAIARLSHPNVITVHEIGLDGDRPHLAMELVEGNTLRSWLTASPRSWHDIVVVFINAGRGLLAAHQAGLVHRDFKPDNVLIGHDGRIRVTDFGLAYPLPGLDRDGPEEPAPEEPGKTSGAVGSDGKDLQERLTRTGALVGTPGYLAPEVLCGCTADFASDQFAYCVALWEALAGERPYPGPTFGDLRRQMAKGPAMLNASKIPRRLRRILRRGLDPDPTNRWSNMDALLTQVRASVRGDLIEGLIVRIERNRGIALAVGVGALLATGVMVAAMPAEGELVAGQLCEPPALDPAQVWSPKAHAGVGKQTAAAALLDQEIAAWGTARVSACKLEPVLRAPRLSCLDAVLARIDVVARGVRVHRDGPQIDAGALLINPKVCEQARVPRLMTNTSPEFFDVVAAWLAHTATPISLPAWAAGALVARAAADPCASSLAHVLAAEIQKTIAERSSQLDEAQQEAERCGDDRVLAETAIATARYTSESEWLSTMGAAKLRLAEVTAHRVDQRDLTAQLDLVRLEAAARAENIDEAIARGFAAMEGFATRGRLRAEISAGLMVLRLRQIRATTADLTAVPDLLAQWRARCVARLGEDDEIVRVLDTRVAEWAFAHEDVASAHAQLERLRHQRPNEKPYRVAGRVVDPHGKPVVGARVTAGRSLRGDSVGAAVSGLRPYAVHVVEADSMRSTKTGFDGRFEIFDALEDSVVIAELGGLRSSPEAIADGVELRLAPTSRLEGRVDLAGEAPTKVRVTVRDVARVSLTSRYELIAPVAPDGSFRVDGVPRHEVRVFAAIDGLTQHLLSGTSLVVRSPTVLGIALSLARSKRVVHVIVRNTAATKLTNAEVLVLSGRVRSMSFLGLKQQFRGGSINIRFARKIEGEHLPSQLVQVAQLGDLFARMTEVPEGVATACALALPERSDDEFVRKSNTHLDKLQVICIEIPQNAELVMIEVPPPPRLPR